MKLTPNSRLWSVISWYKVRSKRRRNLRPQVRIEMDKILGKLQAEREDLLWNTHHSCPDNILQYILDDYTYNGEFSYAVRLHEALRLAFRSAVEEGGLQCDPTLSISIPNLGKEKHSIEDLEKFIDTAFTKFEWRNAGLCTLLVYSIPLSFSRVLQLKWNQFDPLLMDLTVCHRRFEIEEPLYSLLLQQKEDWDWQEYVLPTTTGGQYTKEGMAKIYDKVTEECGIRLNARKIFKAGLEDWQKRRL